MPKPVAAVPAPVYAARPVTPLVASVSLFTKPVITDVKVPPPTVNVLPS